MKNYVLCSVQRSGKTWIADTLRKLGLGHGLELLTEYDRGSAPQQARLAAAEECGSVDGILRCYSDVSRQNGFPCVGIALQWSNWDRFSDQTRVNTLKNIQKTLGPTNIYFIKRKDMLVQAISHLLMIESGYAHSNDPDEGRRIRATISYDRAMLEQSMRHIAGSYAGWGNLFRAAAITPAPLYYEDFVEDPLARFQTLVQSISGERRGLEAIAEAASGLTRISDAIDARFRERYLAGD